MALKQKTVTRQITIVFGDDGLPHHIIISRAVNVMDGAKLVATGVGDVRTLPAGDSIAIATLEGALLDQIAMEDSAAIEAANAAAEVAAARHAATPVGPIGPADPPDGKP